MVARIPSWVTTIHLLGNSAHDLHEFDEAQLNQQFYDAAVMSPMH